MAYLRFIAGNWPFLFAGFLLTFTSSYGQTYFISLFAGEIRAAFSLSDGQWGLVYTIGTSVSAVAMIWAGALTDRFRVRALSLVIMALLAASCIAMALVSSWFGLVVVIFALRFTGQGMMSQIGSVAMARWFVGARGRALSIASMGFAIGQAILPVVFVALFAFFDWRSLWVLAAGLVLLTAPIVRRLLKKERTPQSMSEESEVTGMSGRHWTRAEMLRSGLFWLMVPMILGPSAWGTALFFQQVHLTEVKGWSLVSFVALMPLFTASSIFWTFASGWAIDRFGVKWVVPLQMLPFAACFAILAATDTLWMAGLALIVFGIGQGMQSTAPASFWAEFFGTRHLGSIKAVAAALMVFGSAVGPGVTGALIDAGIPFPDQMVAISIYYLFAGVCATVGILKYQSLIGPN